MPWGTRGRSMSWREPPELMGLAVRAMSRSVISSGLNVSHATAETALNAGTVLCGFWSEMWLSRSTAI